jgi:hypothetical protein
MPTYDVSALAASIDPPSTLLFLGAGSSLPSHAPSSEKIIEHLSQAFHQPAIGFSLAELVELLIQKTGGRKAVINAVRELFVDLRPTAGLLNVPLYDWKALYTTNYDELIEDAYKARTRPLITFDSNFDFGVRGQELATKLYKLHGTISKDVSNGSNSRLVIADSDYANTQEYRTFLFDSLKADLAHSNLIIIGHSLADPDIKETIDRAIALNKGCFGGPGRITLLSYTRDPDRALLYEAKDLRVAFGGIDEFFSALARSTPDLVLVATSSASPIEGAPSLVASTFDVEYECAAAPDVSRLFNGWPATYSDILGGLTFDRSIAQDILATIQQQNKLTAILLGASGVGKTTAMRQVVAGLRRGGYLCYEHKGDLVLDAQAWKTVAKEIALDGRKAVLFVDNAHSHIQELNELVDGLITDNITSLRILIASSRSNWLPRFKSPSLYREGRQFHLTRLNRTEIDRLIALADRKEEVRKLVEDSFIGFSTQEKRRRLAQRCEADMFVCMRNIFASEKFDDIILREYAELELSSQRVYRIVAALEAAGVRVHRQLVVRLLNIDANDIARVLLTLADIVTEYTINVKEGIYGWRGRHQVINGIISKYKFPKWQEKVKLFEDVIDKIHPTYDIEMQSIRELCNVETGLSSIPDKDIQNRLLRKMISVAPGERVPRHRLIRNLINQGSYDQAETEIRIFDKDFGRDGPVARYNIELITARAVNSPGILQEDRIAILEEARQLALVAVERFPYTIRVFAAYCEVGLAMLKLTDDATVFEEAFAALKEADVRIADPDISTIMRRYERRFAYQAIDVALSEAVLTDLEILKEP